MCAVQSCGMYDYESNLMPHIFGSIGAIKPADWSSSDAVAGVHNCLSSTGKRSDMLSVKEEIELENMSLANSAKDRHTLYGQIEKAAKHDFLTPTELCAEHPEDCAVKFATNALLPLDENIESNDSCEESGMATCLGGGCALDLDSCPKKHMPLQSKQALLDISEDWQDESEDNP